MNHRRVFVIVFALILGLSISARLAHADEWNQEIKATFTEPVEVPGQVLPAGTYVFVLADHVSNRDIVQIFSEDRSVLYATVLAVHTERPEASNTALFTFAERRSSMPQAIHAWFYPGSKTGHEFIYTENEAHSSLSVRS